MSEPRANRISRGPSKFPSCRITGARACEEIARCIREPARIRSATHSVRALHLSLSVPHRWSFRETICVRGRTRTMHLRRISGNITRRRWHTGAGTIASSPADNRYGRSDVSSSEVSRGRCDSSETITTAERGSSLPSLYRSP